MQDSLSVDQEKIEFSALVSLDDQISLNDVLLKQPEVRRHRLVSLIIALVMVPFFGVFLALATLSSETGQALSPQVAMEMIRADPWTCFGLPWVTVASAICIGQVVLRLLRRPLLRARIGAALKQRVGVDPDDPRLGEHVRCRFDRGGYAVESAGYRHEIPWRAIRAVRETAEILLVQTSPQAGYVLPKRDIAPDDLRAIRALSARQLAPPPGPWGGAPPRP